VVGYRGPPLTDAPEIAGRVLCQEVPLAARVDLEAWLTFEEGFDSLIGSRAEVGCGWMAVDVGVLDHKVRPHRDHGGIGFDLGRDVIARVVRVENDD